MGEEPKTYCDVENGCMFCDLLLCDGSKRKQFNKGQDQDETISVLDTRDV